LYVACQKQKTTPFELVDPDSAPPEIKEEVMLGLHIMRQTKTYTPKYANDRLSCTNCHFAAGNTFGGQYNGISLVGVTAKYPKQVDHQGPSISLAERINYCYEKSLNGTPLPIDSREMNALLAYLKWISNEVSSVKEMPWLGLPSLTSHHVPNPVNGKALYTKNCSSCHGYQGEGQSIPEDLSIPPLWGEHSFNAAAGMNRISVLSSFIYFNMPLNEPHLREEEALDIAAFIANQPRDPF
jgi:thiosulfate dehydrogenase